MCRVVKEVILQSEYQRILKGYFQYIFQLIVGQCAYLLNLLTCVRHRFAFNQVVTETTAIFIQECNEITFNLQNK